MHYTAMLCCAGFHTQGPTQATRLSDSPVRWIGDESGLPNAPDIWSTATQQNDYSGVGDPRSSVFAPAGCDSVFQEGGWFWEPGGVRGLEDLQLMYVATRWCWQLLGGAGGLLTCFFHGSRHHWCPSNRPAACGASCMSST
jgi:hypothetical protein